MHIYTKYKEKNSYLEIHIKEQNAQKLTSFLLQSLFQQLFRQDSY